MLVTQENAAVSSYAGRLRYDQLASEKTKMPLGALTRVPVAARSGDCVSIVAPLPPRLDVC